jgi:CRISPR-associated endonuclease/helicase Cas3
MHFAHSVENPDRARWQSLPGHLVGVAELAEVRGAKFGAARLARLTGLLHDLGKYSEAFQRYIAGLGPSVDHATAGAQAVMQLGGGRLDKLAAELAAYAIAGHHGGLPDREGVAASLTARLGKPIEPLDPAWRREVHPETGALFPAAFRPHPEQDRHGFQMAMLGRMLFSCLVDADYLDTERFYAAEQGEPVAREWLPLAALIDAFMGRFDAHMAAKRAAAPTTALNVLRQEILESVRQKAGRPKGLFTLNVPTGGGKTLASLGFALAHARAHGMQRIVYGIPFTSVIDQTADIFRGVLGEDVVLEHHSAIEEGKLTGREQRDKLRLAMEDWAAPVVVTTNVQLFESLFANRPARCRKLHNLVDSVIVLDEAQTIPLPVLKPCVAALDELVRNYGCTIVLCTATQPALGAPRFKGGLALGEEAELAPDPTRLHEALRRVTIRPRSDETTDAELVAELTAEAQGLVIVNSRGHALDLYQAARAAGLEGLVHLSTRQTATDRRAILAQVRSRLAAGEVCRVIATSLVEAGVDLDFPRVWRAEAGLDQVIQAAGRCNREGRRPVDESIVTVFRPASARPPREIQAFADAMGRTAVRHHDLSAPSAVTAYFEEVYWQGGESGLDRHGVAEAFRMSGGATQFAYRSVADAFRLVESGMEPVIVAIDEAPQAILAGLKQGWLGPGGAARKLQNYVVQVPPKDRQKLIDNGHVAFADAERQFAVLATESFYARETGLRWEGADELGFDGIL